MTTQDLQKLQQLKTAGWKFNHLMGSQMSADNGVRCFIVDCTTSDEGYKKLFALIEPKHVMTPTQETAYSLTNEKGLVDIYPIVYEAAYQVLYKGKITQKTRREVKALQSNDVRKLGFVPEQYLSTLKSII